MFYKEKVAVKSIRLALGILAGSLVGIQFEAQAYAQAAPEPGKEDTAKVQTVIVTGSNIKRVDAETSSPVQIITRAEIERSGATSLATVIQNLSSNNTGSLKNVDFNGFSPGASTASLRGLGSGATLVLVNGRRIAQYGATGFQSQFANLESIPLDAVDRIEVLLDGASAIYGSEAIAGVINVWLRKDYTGGEVKGSFTSSEKGTGQTKGTVLSYGRGDIAADRYNVMAFFEHSDQKPTLMTEINAFNNSQDYRSKGIVKGDRRSSYSVPGNVLVGKVVTALPGCAPKNINASGRCVIDRFDWTYALPKSSRDALFTRGVYEINPNLSFFVEAGVTQLKTELRYDPQFYANDAANAYAVVGGKRYLFRAGDIGGRGFNVKDIETRLITGFKGTAGDWDYDTSFGYLKSKVDIDQRGSILTSQMNAALADGSYVIGVNNPASVIATISPLLRRSGYNQSMFVDAKLSNSELYRLPAGFLGMATGVEFRRETTQDAYPVDIVQGNVYSFGGLPNLDKRSINTSAIYAELNAPLLKNFEVSTAARADRYSIGGNSFTPKVGAKWTALPTLVLRGTIAKGFRTPNFREISPSQSVGYYNGQQDPLRCITGNEPDCNLSIKGNITGNAALKPEKSTSYTLGSVWEPIKDYSVSLDYYRIERTNEISSLDITYLLLNQNDANFSKFLKRDVNGSVNEVNLPYINIGQTKVSGFDLDLKGKQNLGEYGKLSFNSKINYVVEYLTTPFPDSNTVDYNSTYNQPDWRGSFAISLEKGPWTHEVSGNYVSGYSYIGTPAETCNITAIYGAPSEYCQIKKSVNWGWYSGYRGFKNIKLALKISNLLNTKPPFSARSALADISFPYDRSYNSAVGRQFQVTAQYTFK